MSESEDSSSSESISASIQFKDNEQWADITPLAQDEGPEPICPIAYRPEFVECMSYFRAILKKGWLCCVLVIVFLI
jgi:protein farnesyltransferase/geranylgeranyltransferase type-1 subunit alpha